MDKLSIFVPKYNYNFFFLLDHNRIRIRCLESPLLKWAFCQEYAFKWRVPKNIRRACKAKSEEKEMRKSKAPWWHLGYKDENQMSYWFFRIGTTNGLHPPKWFGLWLKSSPLSMVRCTSLILHPPWRRVDRMCSPSHVLKSRIASNDKH